MYVFSRETKLVFFSQQPTLSTLTYCMAENVNISTDNWNSITKGSSNSSSTPVSSILGTTKTSSMGLLDKPMDGIGIRSRGNEHKLLNKKNRNRRGWGKKRSRKKYNLNINEQIFTIWGSNSNGINGKMDSLKENIKFFKPTCINIQETKLRFTGTVKLEGYWKKR